MPLAEPPAPRIKIFFSDSEISLFNQNRSVEPYRISDEFFYVLQQGKLINKKTKIAANLIIISP